MTTAAKGSGPALSAETRTEIQKARDRYPQPRSAILPALWEVQHQIGHITAEAMTEVAGLLRVAPSEVEAVSTFYSMYFQKPHGRHEVIVCINVSCALRGADGIVSHLGRTLGCASGETTADGEFTWASTVECLGACGGAPAMQLDHAFVENLTPARVDAVLQQARGSAGGVAGGSPDAGRGRRARRADAAGGGAAGGRPEAIHEELRGGFPAATPPSDTSSKRRRRTRRSDAGR